MMDRHLNLLNQHISFYSTVNYDIAEFLLKNGASVGAINGWGYTALDLTLKNSNNTI